MDKHVNVIHKKIAEIFEGLNKIILIPFFHLLVWTLKILLDNHKINVDILLEEVAVLSCLGASLIYNNIQSNYFNEQNQFI